jgi:MSHA biogenesis protein MshL
VQQGFDAELAKLGSEIESQQATQAEPLPEFAEANQEPLAVSSELARFDVSVDNTPLKMFLTGLVADSPINVVIHPDVGGTVSLNLSNVTVVDVLEVLRDIYQLHMAVQGNLVRVMPNVMETEVFTLDYVSVTREGMSDMRVSTGSISDAGTSNQSNNQDNGQTTTSEQTSSGVGGSRVTTENTVDMWSNLRAAIESLIGRGDGRQVIVMEQAGVIVVKALRSELNAVANFLKASEHALQRQVVLEAKILEVILSDSFAQGVNWELLDTIGGLKGGNVSLGVSGSTLNNPDGIDGVFSTTVGLQDFNGIISLLESQGEVKVLSSPRIATVNNQKAVIKVGTDEFFVTNVTSTTTTGTSTTTTPSVTLTPFFSGIALDVTPQISHDGDVILHIHPTVSQVSDQNKVVTIGSDVVNLPLALSTIRESDSIVRAKNEQIIVIGGLMQNSSRRLKAGVPGVSSLPLFGRATNQHRDTFERSELVILVRPIVSDSGRLELDTLDSLRRIAAVEILGD